jgi:catechol 2,3-dioxygenase-like lactoylglutathione lyase family enzyme
VVDWKLEVVILPVSDVDRAKAFYAEQMGFALDFDHDSGTGMRIVQLTPRGSGCSIVVGTGLSAAEPGSVKGLQLVVDDIAAGRAEIAARGVDVSPVRHLVDGQWLDGPGEPWNSFMFFDDPDGNSWTVQERPAS